MNFKILLPSFLSGMCHSPFHSHTTHYGNFHLWKENYFEKQKLTVYFQFSKTLEYLLSHFCVPSSHHKKANKTLKASKQLKTKWNKKQKLVRVLNHSSQKYSQSSCQRASHMTIQGNILMDTTTVAWFWSRIPSTDLSPFGSNNCKQTWEVMWSSPHIALKRCRVAYHFKHCHVNKNICSATKELWEFLQRP